MTKHIVGFSGGIDSQACALLVRQTYGEEDTILMNSDAGNNEDPLTVEFVAEYSAKIHPVVCVNAIIADMWETPGFAETRGYDSNAPLDFCTMMLLKGRPPSSKARFCTSILKLKPQRRFFEQAFGLGGEYEGYDFIRYAGVRRDESRGRADTLDEEWDDYYDCLLRHPIAAWPKQRCFDTVRAAGEFINPLYRLGFGRVGCAPCINSSKDDIVNWSVRRPEMIDKIRGWETLTGRTFFPPCVPGKYTNFIDEVVEWAKTMRGGKVDQGVFPIMHERAAGESKYGLCE